MSTRRIQTLLASFIATSLAAGCSKSQPDDRETPPAAAAEEPAPQAAAEPMPAPAPAPETDAAAALSAYETVREALAQDDLKAAAKAASTLEAVSTSAAAGADGDDKAQLEAVAKAAAQLAATPAEDDPAMRKAFGDVSQAVVAMLEADPALRDGLHLFECPMAPGYRKWVQPDEMLENPYMGTKMSSCGSTADWHASSGATAPHDHGEGGHAHDHGEGDHAH